MLTRLHDLASRCGKQPRPGGAAFGIVALTTILSVTVSNGPSATITWINPGAGDFTNPANWGGGVVPDGDDRADVENAGTVGIAIINAGAHGVCLLLRESGVYSSAAANRARLNRGWFLPLGRTSRRRGTSRRSFFHQKEGGALDTFLTRHLLSAKSLTILVFASTWTHWGGQCFSGS